MMKETLKRQRLFFISLIGIVVVSLIMTTTFAYQTLQVIEEGGSNRTISVKSGVLDITFKATNKIEIENTPLLSDYKAADYVEFTVDNTNSTNDVAYTVTISDISYSENLATKDFKYTITEVIENEETVVADGNFNMLNSNEYILRFINNKYNIISVGKIQKLRLYIWLEETLENQNHLENSRFSGKINITSIFKNDVVNSKETITEASIQYLNDIINCTNDVEIGNYKSCARIIEERLATTKSDYDAGISTSYNIHINTLNKYLPYTCNNLDPNVNKVYDFNKDSIVDELDLNMLTSEEVYGKTGITENSPEYMMDLNKDGEIGYSDMSELIDQGISSNPVHLNLICDSTTIDTCINDMTLFQPVVVLNESLIYECY